MTIRHSLKLVLFSLFLLPRPSLAQIQAPESIESRVESYQSCLDNLGQDDRYRSTQDDADRMDQYLDHQRQLMNEIANNRSKDRATERRRLTYLSWVLTRKLSECHDLSEGPDKPRYIYLVGQQAKSDGKSFELVAATLAQHMLDKNCTETPEVCKSQVVIKQQIQKVDLISYLQLLAPQSVKYFSYIGHGWSYGILIGFKDMLVASDWSPNSKITNLQWQKERNGALYSDDMNYFGPILSRVLDPNAEVEIYACNTGDFLAPMLKAELADSVRVRASFSGMNFKRLQNIPDWSFSLPSGEKFNGIPTSMIPDLRNAFKFVSPKEFSYSQDFAALEKKAAEKSKNPKIGYNDLVSAVVTRVGRKEAWFAWLTKTTNHPKLIVFDERDRKSIERIFKIPPPGHGTWEDDLDITYSQYLKISRLVLQNVKLSQRAYYKGLFSRINSCVREGVAQYY